MSAVTMGRVEMTGEDNVQRVTHRDVPAQRPSFGKEWSNLDTIEGRTLQAREG